MRLHASHSSPYVKITPYLLGLCCIITSYTYANDATDLSMFGEDLGIVLSATRLAQPKTEAPASITVIDSEMIKLSGAKNIADLFRLVPGMHVANYRGNRPVVGYQGVNSEYPQGVQLLIDGKSEYSPLFGGISWANLPLLLEDIERIEVIRGPNSTTFGSNAFQSVINITTTHSSQVNGTQIKSTLGERGYNRTLLKTAGHTDDLDFRVSLSHRDDEGYKNNFDDSRLDLLTARVDYKLGSKDTLQLNLGAINNLRQTANPDDPQDPTDPIRNQDESYYTLHGKWEHTVDSTQQFTTQLSYTVMDSKDKHTRTYDDNVLGPDVSITLDQTATFDRWDFEFEHLLKPSDNTRLAWGLGLRSDRVTMPLWTGTDKQHDNSIQRLFGNLEWRATEQLIINTGALWEHSQIAGDNVSPRFAINYLLTPKHSVRMIASRTFRAPVLVEHNFDANINFQTGVGELVVPFLRSPEHTVEPETVNSFEVGYHGIYFANALSVDLKLFRNEYDDLIALEDRDIPNAITFNGFPYADAEIAFLDNYLNAQVNGYEIEINYRPNRQNLLHMGYSYNHVSRSADERALESVPKDTFNLLAAHTFDNQLWSSIAYYYTGSMEHKISGNPQGPTRRLDLNAGKSFNVAADQQLDISVSLQLALDKNIDFLKQFNLDNRAYVEVSYNFK